MFWFIPPATFKAVLCQATFCTEPSIVIVEGSFYCLQHGTNMLLGPDLNGAHTH